MTDTINNNHCLGLAMRAICTKVQQVLTEDVANTWHHHQSVATLLHSFPVLSINVSVSRIVFYTLSTTASFACKHNCMNAYCHIHIVITCHGGFIIIQHVSIELTINGWLLTQSTSI
uniref:Uncharacterized protein n=1 Tax=Glossina brevipalpis TaxID=37001 RepID=A0A1A9WED3_9MUSC